MLEHNGLHEIFHPSVSWIMKSGVHLEYTPEDTLKSAIFISGDDGSVAVKEPIVTEVCSSNDDLKIINSKFNSVTADETNCANAGDSLQKPDTPHNNIEECPKEVTDESNDPQPGSANCCRGIGSDSGCLDKVNATDGDGGSLSVGVKHPTKRSVIPKKPAPYLKRRQGVSAWCSKIRKQGLPVKEPAGAVIKQQQQQQCMNSPRTPVVQESVRSEQSKAQSSKTNLPRRVKSSVKNQSSNKNVNVPCRGYKQPDHINNSESSESKKDKVGDEEEMKNKDDKENRGNNYTDDGNNNDDYSQCTTHLLARPMMINSRDLEKSINHLSVELMHTSLFNESHKEARDLEEFELLEEFAETSSFPNLTTSFISKLNKSKCGLHRSSQQKQTVEALKGNQSTSRDDSAVALNDKQLSTVAQHHSEHHHHHLTSNYNQPVNNLKKNMTTSQFTSSSSSSSSTNDNLHNVDSILANTIAPVYKECKVTPHFHIIKAPCEEIQSLSSTTLVNQKQTEKCHDDNDDDDNNNKNEMISTFQQINALPASSDPLQQCDHYDFDDAHSWSFSASDLNDIKLSSGFDFSETSLTSCCGDLGNQPNESLTKTTTTTTVKTTRPILIPESNKSSSFIPNHQEVGKVKRITFSDTVNHNTCTSFPQNKKSIQSHNENDAIISTNNSNELLKEHLNSSDQGNVTCGDEQSVVKQWINRLEEEVKRFKVENANLNKMKTELQDKSRQLETEKARFEESKMKEKKEFEEYKEAEMKKLKKEKRVLEEYQRALKTMPNKKDREEIERLKQELDESRVDMGKREIRWHAALSRLRTRNEELESERDELKSRISRLEEERISLQAQLTKLKVSTANESSGNKQRLSSSSLRQTVNSISQSISFTPHNGNTSKALDDGNISHRQQSRQPSATRSLSSSSSRPVSRLNHPDRLGTITSKQTTTSSNHQKSNLTSNKTSNTIQSTQKLCQQESTSSVTGTRESIASGGGYFTGDDDCGSIGGSSGRVVKFSTRSTDPEYDNDVADIDGGGNLLCNGDHSKQKSTHLRINKEINCCDKNNVIQAPLDSHISQRKDNVNRLGNNCQERLPIPGTAASGTIVRSVKHTDGSIEQTYSNGAVIVSYANGSVKEIFPDTITVVVSLFNGDIKRTLPDGRVIYHYAADGTVQTTYPDGTEEIIYPDGHQEIIHAHALQQINPPTAAVDSLKSLPNEQICRRLSNGDKEILLPNGQREIHSNSGIKCRIYPDGTTKTVFPDGRHETRYSSGRLRVKDANGTLLLDTRLPVASACHPVMNNNNNNLDNLVSRIPNGSSNGDSLKNITSKCTN
ncbi:unnamed protein product [Trichobilharzia szidati]|nr:unnamed protein product [Trichobilharzia szidati]CAH8856671.1 unnamed protein product [Trichobilharzia szidati]